MSDPAKPTVLPPDAMHPYRGQVEGFAALPPKGRPREEILRELGGFARQEDARWETGRVSGSYYHDGKEHYAFLNDVFALFSHVNLLQRDMCPSGTKIEAVVLGLVKAGAIGLVTTHELTLTRIAEGLGTKGANVHFADHFEDGVMTFDFRLHTGVVRNSNALALMRAVGLDV